LPVKFACCLNPRCTNRVEFREKDSGRQKGFCSDACRVQTNRDHDALVTALSNAAIYDNSDPHVMSKIHWHLERYPPRKPAHATEPDIQMDIASPPATPPPSTLPSSTGTTWLMPLLTDRNLAKALARNPRTPDEVLSLLAQDADPAIRSLVAANASTAPYVLEVLGHDPRPSVRERAARNPAMPTMARKRLHRDRSGAVRKAARAGEQAQNGSKRIERELERAQRIRTELRDPEVFAQTYAITLTHEIAEAFDLVGDDIDTVLSYFTAAIAALKGRVPTLMPVAVSAERQHQTAERSLQRRREQTQRTWPGDPGEPCQVPLIATWVDALQTHMFHPDDVDEDARRVITEQLTAMFGALGMTGPLTASDVRFVPRWVRRYCAISP